MPHSTGAATAGPARIPIESNTPSVKFSSRPESLGNPRLGAEYERVLLDGREFLNDQAVCGAPLSELLCDKVASPR